MELKIFVTIILTLLGYALARHERNLVFENTGVFKLIIGVGIPIDINEKGTSLNWLSNIQAMYKLPDDIKYYNPSVSHTKKSMKNGMGGDLFFAVFNKIFHRLGFSQMENFFSFMCKTEKLKYTKTSGLLEEVFHVVIMQILKSPKFGFIIQNLQNHRDCYVRGCKKCSLSINEVNPPSYCREKYP